MNFSNEEYAFLFMNAKFFEVGTEEALIIIEIVESTTPQETFQEMLHYFIELRIAFKLENPTFMDTFNKYKKELFNQQLLFFKLPFSLHFM